jgi:hypothetical protein
MVLLAGLLSGCANGFLNPNLNPIAVAETPEQKYAAVKLSYDALLTPAVQLIEDETAPAPLRLALQEIVAQSGETYRSLNAAHVDYLVARATFAGAERDRRLAVVGAELESWIAKLEGHTDSIAKSLGR